MSSRSALLGALALAALVACGGADTDDSDARPAASGPAATQAGASTRLIRIGDFDQPLFVTAPPEDRSRLYVVEQTGRVRVMVNGRLRSQPFLDVRDDIVSGGEQGLLGLAFAPDFEESGLVYASFTDRNGDSRIVEYRAANPDRADEGSARTVLGVGQPESNHNGGMIAFGPDDLLYIGLGDGGGAGDRHGARGNGQNLNTLLGKILRIDPRRSGSRSYSIPRDNPFVGRSGRDEIYLYGVRNPWRFSFDRATGALAVGDVGQNAQEEVTYFARGRGRGANLGWRVWEGRNRFTNERAPGAVFPQLVYSNGAQGNCAVTGGYVSRSPELPGLRGRYVYGDYCRGVLYAVTLSSSRAKGRRALGPQVSQLSSFGEDAIGRLYVTSSSGPVYRIDER